MTRITPHGMSPNDSHYSEPIMLPGGAQAQIIREHVEEPDGGVLAVSIDGVTARYNMNVVDQLGEGNRAVGEVAVFQAVAAAYQEGRFVDGADASSVFQS